LAIADHLKVFYQGQWKHALVTDNARPTADAKGSEPESVVFLCEVTPGCFRIVQQSKDAFLSDNAPPSFQRHHLLVQSPVASDFSVEEVVARARQQLTLQQTHRFNNDSERFVDWCQTNRNRAPKTLQQNQLQRNLETLDIQDPRLRHLIQVCGIFSKADQFAVHSRLLNPWVLVADASEQMASWLSQQVFNATPPAQSWQSQTSSPDASLTDSKSMRSKRWAKRWVSGVGKVSAALMGFAAGGPVTAITALATWNAHKKLSDNTIERIKAGLSRHGHDLDSEST